ncbi:MAG: YIP1 family protein [Candidatus Aminicenantes bacterium]|nr:YIP1 family protein [Candidatus Aminicenantes bacterium]
MIKNLYLTVFDPYKVGEGLKEKKSWVLVALIVFILTLAFSLPYSYKGYQEAMSQLEIQKPELVKKLKDAGRWESMINVSQKAIMIRTSVGVLITYVFSIVVTGVLLLLGIRFVTPEGDYATMIASWTHATFINYSIASLVKGLIIWAKGSTLGVTTSLLIFFNASPLSKTGRVLQAFDIFDIWAAIACGLIIAGALSIEKKKGVYVSLGVWLIKSILLAGLAMISPGM